MLDVHIDVISPRSLTFPGSEIVLPRSRQAPTALLIVLGHNVAYFHCPSYPIQSNLGASYLKASKMPNQVVSGCEGILPSVGDKHHLDLGI